MFTIFNLISSTFKFSSETKQQQGDEKEEEKIVHRRRKGCRTGIDMVGVSPMCVCVCVYVLMPLKTKERMKR